MVTNGTSHLPVSPSSECYWEFSRKLSLNFLSLSDGPDGSEVMCWKDKHYTNTTFFSLFWEIWNHLQYKLPDNKDMYVITIIIAVHANTVTPSFYRKTCCCCRVSLIFAFFFHCSCYVFEMKTTKHRLVVRHTTDQLVLTGAVDLLALMQLDFVKVAVRKQNEWNKKCARWKINRDCNHPQQLRMGLELQQRHRQLLNTYNNNIY